MHCEVIAIGSELLLGQHVDTNSAWIGEQLALAGIDSYFQTRVGDNLERIVTTLRIALERNEAVITCGGLGPTQDDLTRVAIARLMNVPLVRNEAAVEHIRQRFRIRNRPMPDSNLQQADVPQGASLIPEMPGTAPGLICPVGDKVLYAVPGVPWEMREMVGATVLPDLQRRAGLTATIRSRVLRTWGQPESGLAEMLAERIQTLDAIGNPTLAFLASGIEGIKIRITAKAADEARAQAMLAEEEARVRGILGELVFAADEQGMEDTVIQMLAERGWTLAVAESISGGLVTARLSAAPMAGPILRGGIACQAPELNAQLLGASAQDIQDPAALASAMARGVSRLMGATVGLATADAPVAQQDAAKGTVFMGLAIDGVAQSQAIHLPGKRDQIRQFAVISLLNWLRLRLLERR
ncbi:MAG: CinA family nicotinamide mononucleotide deamidase-related protein [Gammaproteobacteria bacterium]|nr:CinA family nicotinamide mononucleotide deamidase-related protein [Gammaproteobacteria bacterium]MCP5458642.1 CinA family nicotinamide mononucleotide deamidase-related protein [Gammaproteobacteria bacterium]